MGGFALASVFPTVVLFGDALTWHPPLGLLDMVAMLFPAAAINTVENLPKMHFYDLATHLGDVGQTPTV